MVTPAQIIDLGKLYQKTFGSKPYVIGKDGQLSDAQGPEYKITGSQGIATVNGQQLTQKGSLIAQQYKGVEIWLPVTIYVGTLAFSYLPYSVVRISGQKTIIKTPLSDRIGTVKEQYNIDDYKISLKGFLIGDNQQFPEDSIENLKQLYEAKLAVTIDNALTNIFLSNKDLAFDEQRRVVITSLELPEVQGGRKNVRPFVMEMESDSVFTLELSTSSS